MNNYRAVLSVADDILTLPAEVEALPHSSSAFCGAAGSCAPSVGRGHSPLTLVESRHERGRLSSRPTTPYPPPPHSPVDRLFRGTVSENTNQPLGLGFWVSRWRRIKWKGREEDCGGGGGGEGAPGSPLASPPSIPLPLSLSCSRTHHLASAAHALDRELRVRTQRHFRPRPILKVLLLAGIKMMYHHYSSSKVSVSILPTLIGTA